jgi:hypothetical protein
MKRSFLKLLLVGLLSTTFLACGRGYYARAPYPPPPPPGYRAVVVSPGPGYVWIDGYQDWRGRRYAWVPGRWARPPYARARWVAPHWQHRGRDRVWVRGQWRR